MFKMSELKKIERIEISRKKQLIKQKQKENVDVGVY